MTTTTDLAAFSDGALATAATAALTIADIRRYLCPKATEQEAYLFLRLCQAQGLNPFTRDAYLIKYSDSQPATMVVGKEAFTKRAEAHPQFDGFRAGVIVLRGETLEHLTASFAPPKTTLFGGWAEVYRKDRAHPVHCEVALDEFSTGQTGWKRMPGTMIRKVALVSALREAFPSSFAGLYDAAEMRVDVTADGEIVEPPRATPSQPEDFIARGGAQEPRRATEPPPTVSRATNAPARTPTPVSAPRQPEAQPAGAPTSREELRQAMEGLGYTPAAVQRALSQVTLVGQGAVDEEPAIAQVWAAILDARAKRQVRESQPPAAPATEGA